MIERMTILLFCLLLAIPFQADAQKKKKSADKNAQEEQNDGDAFNKLIKDATHIEGFFDLYQTEDKLYMAIDQNHLERDFLMSYQIARGVGASGLYGGTMLSIFEPNIVALQKHEGKIFLVQKPHRYKTDEDTPQQKALTLT